MERTHTRTFLRREHEELGQWGWKPDWEPTFDPMFEGFSVAHDVIEHIPGTPAGMHGEMMAFGVMHMVRGFSYFDSRYTIFQAQGSDLESFIRDAGPGDFTIPVPPEVSDEEVRQLCPDFNEDELRREFASAIDAVRYDAAGHEHFRFPSGYVRDLVGWVKHGIVNAGAYFDRMDRKAWQVRDLFEKIEGAYNSQGLNKAFSEDDFSYDDRLVITVDYEAMRVKVDIDRAEDRWDGEDELEAVEEFA